MTVNMDRSCSVLKRSGEILYAVFERHPCAFLRWSFSPNQQGDQSHWKPCRCLIRIKCCVSTYILVDLPWTAKPPLISGSQSSSFCRAPEVTTYRVFYHISKSFKLRDIESRANLGICLNFKPTITQVTFTPKRKDWSRKVCANLLLLRVISYSHTDMIITCATVIFQMSGLYVDCS
jgi:hypothetical protein